MQSDTGSNLNIAVPGAFTDAVLKTVEVLATDYKKYDNVMTSLADADDGFDWFIRITKDGTLYQKELAIGYPTIGTNPFQGMVVLEYPGNIVQYYMTEPMSESGTNIFIFGEGEGSSMVVGLFEQTDMIASGHPRWDFSLSRKDMDSQEAVSGFAAQQGAVRKPPLPVIKLNTKANLEPEFGAFGLGDTCGIVIKDPRFPGNGIDLRKRLIKWELRPQSSDSVEEASYVFDGDPDV